jgi:hypothetical protein
VFTTTSLQEASDDFETIIAGIAKILTLWRQPIVKTVTILRCGVRSSLRMEGSRESKG